MPGKARARRRARRSRKRSSYFEYGEGVTRKDAFGSVVLLVAGLVAIIGIASNSGALDLSALSVSSGNLAGYAATEAVMAKNSNNLDCLNACLNNCVYEADVSSCLDAAVETCRNVCGI